MNRLESDAPSIAGLLAADHSIGAEHADLLLLEYGDYECPSCCEAEPVTLLLVETFGRQLRFIYRHFPLIEVHPHAEMAAEAAEAAAAQGKFWEMHHRLFTHSQHLQLSALTHYAEQIELDMRRFNAEMADRIYTQRVREHRRTGEQRSTLPSLVSSRNPGSATASSPPSTPYERRWKLYTHCSTSSAACRR